MEVQDLDAPTHVGQQVGACADRAGGDDFAVGAVDVSFKAEGAQADLFLGEVSDVVGVDAAVGADELLPTHALCFFAQTAGQLLAEAFKEGVGFFAAGAGLG